MNQFQLKQDIVFKAGTVFHCIDNSKRTFVSGNYEATIGLTPDTHGGLIYNIDLGDPEILKYFQEEADE